MAEVQYFRQCTYSVNTHKTYQTFYRAYIKFCDLLHLPLVPATSKALCMYAAFLARFLLPQSVYLYVHFVGLLHKEQGLPNPLADNWLITSVLKGIRRVYGVPPRPRLPMTTDILLKIRSRLNLSCSKQASFWAVCLVSFFGLFRKSHLLPVLSPQFNAAQQFTRADFTSTPYGYSVLVRWSKTIQMGQRTLTVPLILLPRSPLCPVWAIRHAFSLAPGASSLSQAFCFQTSTRHCSVLTYKTFMVILKSILLELGLNPHDYGTHSFRRGGASFALEAGVPLDVISIMGDWKSDSVFLYLHMPLGQRLSAQRVIASHISTISHLPS